jgi:hypothetical protein
MRRLPIVLACVFVAVKLAVAVMARLSPDSIPYALEWIVRHDAPSFWAAATTTELFFDQTRLLPRDPEAIFFDAALSVFTGLEWYLCGALIRGVMLGRKRNG